MGRLIDTSELAKHIALQKKRFGNLLEVPICNVFTDMIRDTPTVDAIPKADYENRLKADLEAILVDLQVEIEKQKFDNHIDKGTWNSAISVCSEAIQEKINVLKGDMDEKV